MDKNTLLGMILMGMVLFGFMMFTEGNKQNRDALVEETAQTQAEKAEKEQSLRIDTITAAEAAAVPAIMRQIGTERTDSLAPAEYRYRTDKVNLLYDGTAVTGTVQAVDTVLTYAAVTGAQFGDDLSPANRRAAIENLRSALADADRYRGFARYLSGEDRTVTLKNDLLELEIASKGGRISRATLQKYFTYLPNKQNEKQIDTAKVEICRPEDASYSFVLTSATNRFDTADFYFTPEQVNDSTVVMKLDLGDGASWALRYTLAPDSYVVRMEVVQSGMQKIIPPSVATADFVWAQKLARNERGRTFEERNSGLFYKFLGDSPDDLAMQGDKQKSLDQRLKWIAFKNQFFSTVMIPRTSFTSAEVATVDLRETPGYLKDLSAKATMDYTSTQEVPVAIDIFMGPNLYPLLSGLDSQLKASKDDPSLELTRLIPLGWTLFRWINTLIIIPVFTFLSGFISNYGIIILLLTIFIKIILFPFTYKSYMSQAKMRVLAPEIKEINDKYPGNENAMTRQQKTMALYSKAGASPFSGCLPMLLQMPILIAMFSFFPSAIELRGESFLWAKDLAAPDVICTLPFTIPWFGNHVSLFCLLMTVTNIIYTRINMASQPSSSSMPGMKWMMYLMPVMFLFFFNDYASGLSYYYFLSLLITIVQTYIFRMVVDDKKVRARMAENAKKPRKKSGFMARLEEMQRQQQAMLREQQKKGGRKG